MLTTLLPGCLLSEIGSCVAWELFSTPLRDVETVDGNHHHDYQHSHVDLTALTPKMAHRQMRYERPQRMNNILTSATEPYDLSLSRSFQNLSHLPPSYELALKSDLSDKDIDEYYSRKHHPDFGGRGPTHMVKLNAEPQQHQQRQRPRRVQRAMSQDHVLSPPRTPRRGDYGLSSYGVMAAAAYGSSRHLSEEQLLSADRLHSQDPLLLSPAMRRDKFREKAMARAMSHADMLMPTTPVMDRHKVTKMHSQPSASTDSYNTLTVNHQGTTSKRQAFASRRTHTVDHLQYIPGHHHHTYHTASKNEIAAAAQLHMFIAAAVLIAICFSIDKDSSNTSCQPSYWRGPIPSLPRLASCLGFRGIPSLLLAFGPASSPPEGVPSPPALSSATGQAHLLSLQRGLSITAAGLQNCFSSGLTP
ncbi:protein shisa-6-like [Archocentrus centrarchus]|uniref:protein shisa-6-like n=1 Tax=Archocentrus centrarchus TaxID=63155 RepID=UPI0011EA3B55|nr:protein shisa-6-like [Archocentrus centrarchus]